jgi:hypothetical protein
LSSSHWRRLLHNGIVTYPELLRTALGQRLPMTKALELLRGSGASPAEAAQALQDVTGASPEEARATVAASRAWSGPRSGISLGAGFREWYGAIGQHGRSGHGSASVLPHLARQAHAQAGPARTPRR